MIGHAGLPSVDKFKLSYGCVGLMTLEFRRPNLPITTRRVTCLAARQVRPNLAGAARFDIRRNLDGLDSISVANAKCPDLRSFAEQRLTSRNDMLHDEDLRAPLGDLGMNLD